jgi:hypothetical protein
MTEALEFHEYGLYLTFKFSSMEEGPNSRKRPVREEQPGPPFNHRTTGSFFGSLRDSKNPGYAVNISEIVDE